MRPKAKDRFCLHAMEGGQKDIWIMQPDGTGKQKLTNDETADDFAAASPDGQRVVWTRGVFSEPESEIWVMNIDGSGKRQLTLNDASDGGVATSRTSLLWT
jgi:hypothetical protein